MSDSSSSDLDSVSDSSDSSDSTTSGDSSSSSGFQYPRQSPLSILRNSNRINVTIMDASHNRSTASEGEPFNLSNASGGESRNQSNASDGEAASPSGARSMSVNVTRMLAEIGSINRYCENVSAQIGHDISPATSTPTLIRGNRRRRNDMTPEEVIDLSSWMGPPARPTANRAPEAVIDLCTPDRSHTARPTGRRGNSQPSTSNADIVVLDESSPPKRECLDQSQREDSYKCPVCLESVRAREPVSTKCGHVFCKECIITAINNLHKCPLCNKKMTHRMYSRIYL